MKQIALWVFTLLLLHNRWTEPFHADWRGISGLFVLPLAILSSGKWIVDVIENDRDDFVIRTVRFVWSLL